MAYAWNESLSTGNPAVDAEHKQLIQQVNRLLDAMKQARGKEEIQPILSFLGRYVDEHFRHEEAAFARLDCPEQKANVRAHAEFRKTVDELVARYQREGASPSLTIELKNKLGDWLVSHIKNVDCKLGAIARAA
ncbi:MAG: bacteriohemerythrin [Fimbriimonadaceae bacterium]